MAEKYIEVTGRNEDKAIETALEQLKLTRNDVSVEILERAKSGFLGLGATQARVRVTYQAEEEAPAASQPEPAPEAPAARHARAVE
ncbi:MAG: Jag N-terminal domain-containing protein, partial [Oscillospiraceae bacterium]|nr:Jag N-terminal domain-containing protein [Oscillospiraceae bacterium]